ncbi:hypothetical protein M758_12G014600 [Ceratodon purpureus]|nr:hypothetical protein M758_12G014600 [Ceratodon purpureus]KAG0597691.1 hypothetical protein M758_12G014600 [Ceratodon purpureus]
MGSLMPGWDTLPNPKKVMKRSKTSLTKEEIEAYWRHKQLEIEAHSKENDAQNANSLPVISETKLTTTTVTSDGSTETQEVVINWPQPTASSRDWWTRSNWAYLNAPPELSEYPGQPRHCPYVPQHDVATRYNRSASSVV